SQVISSYGWVPSVLKTRCIFNPPLVTVFAGMESPQFLVLTTLSVRTLEPGTQLPHCVPGGLWLTGGDRVGAALGTHDGDLRLEVGRALEGAVDGGEPEVGDLVEDAQGS